ncbi:MAG: phosphoadenosine phosphosulfate reductase family protein [Rhodobacteraceae bacterium]|nr:phosphoadenosine phosphosulfate reductase family protein [Paracoccaceae bacterium]
MNEQPNLVAAFSGGADSTAMVLAMADKGESFDCLFTETGNELPGVIEHIESVCEHVGAELIFPQTRNTLHTLIAKFGALPNHRMRWCTRMLKIEPCIVFLKRNPGTTLCVGLRHDEELRQGLYGDYATYRYPLRELGWSRQDVVSYCKHHGFSPPKRTDCALCYDQRLIEWWNLWKDHPNEFQRGIKHENDTIHTFRSPSRDTWPAKLVQLRTRFENGEKPTRSKERDGADSSVCRVCRF